MSAQSTKPETSTRLVMATVTDTNHRARGRMPVTITFDANGPQIAMHDGQQYLYNGTQGTNRATGLPVRKMTSMSTETFLWITLDGTQIWED